MTFADWRGEARATNPWLSDYGFLLLRGRCRALRPPTFHFTHFQLTQSRSEGAGAVTSAP